MAAPDHTNRPSPSLIRDHRGAAMLEFALIAPVFLMTLLGILCYGGYFWRAHTLQEIANDAARAAIPGLTAEERNALARSAVSSEIAQIGGIAQARTTTAISETGDLLRVSISYDGSSDAFMALGLVPLPSSTLTRSATMRLGGL